MNVTVMTITGEDFMFPDCTLDFDTTIIQIVDDGKTTTFPLTSVLWFSFDKPRGFTKAEVAEMMVRP